MATESEPGRADPRITVGRFSIRMESVYGVATVLPVLVLYSLVAVLPIAFAVWASLHEIPLLSPQWEYTGLQNYREVVAYDRFWASMWRGGLFMVGSTLFQLAVGVWIALVVNRLSRGRRLVNTVVFAAYLVPTIVVVLVARFLFDVNFGALHLVGAEWLGLWDPNQFVLGVTEWAMPLIVLVGSWKFAIFVTIFTLAQLSAIPDELYEAAKVMGANRWEMFRDITFPRIKNVILIVVLLRAIFMFNKFDIIWMLTQGGPGRATTTLPVLAFREAFVGSRFGFANAMAVVMFLILATGGIAYFVLFKPTEEVET